MLFLCATLGMAGGRYEVIEYTGNAVKTLSMQERMTLTNMSTELGAQTALIAGCHDDGMAGGAGVDAATLAAIDPRQWRSDADAPVLATHRFDAGTLAPHVAAPHSPANSARSGRRRADRHRLSGRVHRRQARRPAHGRALRGRKVAPGVSLRWRRHRCATSNKRPRRHARRADGCRRGTAAERVQCCAGYGASRFPAGSRHRLDRAQLRPHGRCR
jgi:3-isopropylmalate/(R)-2-methylmalate dehydratase large subunit